jgi:predicted kinase
MSKVIMMIGIQGSGKTTKAKELAKEYNAKIFSSDNIRKEFPDLENEYVFKNLYKYAKLYADSGKNIILDDTNITIKSRRQAFKNLKGHEFIAYIMNTPVQECKDRVSKRNEDPTAHHVPLDVIDKYIKSFEIPFYEEGFKEIIINTNEKYSVKDRMLLFKIMQEFDQKSKHHDFTLWEHSVRVAQQLPKIWFEAGMFHDIGKLFTQSIDKNGEAHYYSHANVGAYFLLSNLKFTPERARLLDILFIINYHMKPFDWKAESTVHKWNNIFGEKKTKMLIQFNDFDKKGAKNGS